MARRQTLIQLTHDLLDRLDSFRASEGLSRSEVVRAAIEHYLATDREAEIDRLIVESYTCQPQRQALGEQAANRLIASEPW
jgi:metal-responsive CopG/Arc/MetJ family transcriptional regulator